MRIKFALAASLLAASLSSAGCIEDSDCGICDPDNLVLESISGLNYANKKVHVLGPDCEGANCPGSIDSGTYFIENIGPCEQSDQARESPRGPEEYCKISPLNGAGRRGLEFVFNNLLDPSSIELVRKRPDNPQLFEVYDWKQRVVEIQGPITRFNGDYFKGTSERPDRVTRLVNLSCIDNLAAAGVPFSHVDYEDPATNPCNQIDPATGLPLKMDMGGTIKSYGGITTTYGNSCATPDDGPDTCCSECDFLLSTQVAKYGLTSAASGDVERADVEGLLRNPNVSLAAIDDPATVDPDAFVEPEGGAIVCDPTDGDKYIQCRDFIPWVNRTLEERTYRYGFCDPKDPACEAQQFKLPYYDQLRETHPSARPDNLERGDAPCAVDNHCTSVESGHGLVGTECVGHLESDPSVACSPEHTEGCVEGRCVAEWFVGCEQQSDLTGPVGFCLDRRFSNAGVGACYRTNAGFDALCDIDGNNCQPGPPNAQLAYCDHDENGTMTAAECCQESLGGGTLCDPAFQDLTPVSNYSRNDTLPEPTRDCRCPSSGTFADFADDPICAHAFQTGCFDAEGNLRPERAGHYAVKFVERPGGVIYDPAVKGFEFRPSNTGGVPRATVEWCAERGGLIESRNREDGWRANDEGFIDNYEDFDRAMCSGQEYTVVFAEPGDGQFVKDKADNTLAGKSVYTFETPDFHVVPGSGFPTDNIRIGACGWFSLRFSNKYDLSPENVNKVQLWRIAARGDTSTDNYLAPYPDNAQDSGAASCPVGPVAGGIGCATTKAERADDPCRPPCLTVNAENASDGELEVQVDPAEFGPVLADGQTYRMTVPGLQSMADLQGPDGTALYQQAFWDACGMPLILGGASEVDYLYDFTVDKPTCKEDADQDDVPLSCDNAPDFYNPLQGDMDGDGVGDAIDLCPTVPSAANNKADSDDDGVGNECDNCRQLPKSYNEDEANPPAYMLVRNIPFQFDTDGDGIGDACDNCVHTPNCQDYGGDNRYEVGDPIAYDVEALCNEDLDNNMIGDACEPNDPDERLFDFAAGPIGIGPDDDFDQDGIINVRDACPRQPLTDTLACTTDEDCPTGRKCETSGICDHLDSDGDDVGDLCDTCMFVANPMQVMDGQMQEDDEDGDFVGQACETHNECYNQPDARPFGFFEVAANGNCCTVALVEDDAGFLFNRLTYDPDDPRPLSDPDGIPIFVECSEAQQDADMCRQLPTSVAARPGVLDAPAGCQAALEDAYGEDATALDNRQLTSQSFDDLGELWDRMCFLPQFDQDYDGVGDICDLCPIDFDPNNRAFVDPDTGKTWPNAGAVCNGEYAIDLRCDDDEEEGTGTGTGGEGGTGTDGGDMGGSGTG